MTKEGNNIEFARWPQFAEDEIKAVAAVLESGKVNYWTGEQCKLFEEEFADYIGVDYAVAVANGTVALEAALYALGIGAGDEVITTSRTFIASASCIVARGAKPIMADVDLVSQNITADTIRAVLTPQTKAIIAVHLAGWPCDMDSILALAEEHGLYVIEDCAQAHGAVYKGRKVGSIGDIAAFSFCQDKIMTTGGEGGMITTNNSDLWKKMWMYKDHGKSLKSLDRSDHSFGFRWLHDQFGTNLRMTEMQAAIGRLQLQKLPKWLDNRRGNAAILNAAFKDISALRVAIPPEDIEHAYYKYYVFVQPEKLVSGWNRDRIAVAINEKGIPCFAGSCSEIYLEKAFTSQGWGLNARLPVAQELGEVSLMLQVHPTLSEEYINWGCEVVSGILEKACRD